MTGDGRRPPPEPVDLPHTWRPIGPLVAGSVAGGVLLIIMAALWLTFEDQTRASITPFQRGTTVFLFGIGFAALYALVRSRVEAHRDKLVVVNGYRRREFTWAEVVAVNLPPGAPWVTLDLADGNTVSAMGIQGSEGTSARHAVRQLRLLLDSPDAP